MGDRGLICTICGSYEHRASSCPRRPNPFRASAGPVVEHGRWLTRALFYEWKHATETLEPIYTLRDDDLKDPHNLEKVYPSLRRLYLECADPTEYQFATAFLGGWDHWQVLSNADWFQPHIQKWRSELEVRLQSEAIQRIKDEAMADGRNGFAANRFLVSQGWISKKAEPNRRGRPSKEEIRKIAVQEAFNERTIEDDLKRLGIDTNEAIN